ncbi:MAG: AAA family ATPase [Thermodesulfovibrionales bacterium]
MDPLIACAIKEEILRNVLKTHRTLLLTGWPGTGKTTTALKVSAEEAAVAYYSEAGKGVPSLFEKDSDTVLRVRDLSEMSAPSGRVLVVDDVAAAAPPLISLLSEGRESRKVIVIATMLNAVRELLSLVDAVVRFKSTTAELLHSRLRDLHARSS